MKQLSLWGFRHKWTARVLIVLSYLLLNCLALAVGDILFSYGIEASGFIVYATAAVYLAVFLLYPFYRHRKEYKNYYRFQKTCDAILIATSFLLVTSAANLRHTTNSPFHFPAAQAVVPIDIQPAKATAVAEKSKVKSLVKSFKGKLSSALQKIKAYYQSRSLGGQIALIFLAVVLAAALLYLVLALSCSIACAGSDGAAILVALLGSAGVIFLFVRALRGIRRMRRREQDGEPRRVTS
jgi:hypothetical protein